MCILCHTALIAFCAGRMQALTNLSAPAQVNLEEEDQPVSLILMCSAPPPRPEVLAQIVLPADPPQAGVDLAIDANRDLAVPTNSFLGAGAFGQVSAWRTGDGHSSLLCCLRQQLPAVSHR